MPSNGAKFIPQGHQLRVVHDTGYLATPGEGCCHGEMLVKHQAQKSLPL